MTKFTLIVAVAVLLSGASMAQDKVLVNQNPTFGARTQSVNKTDLAHSEY